MPLLDTTVLIDIGKAGRTADSVHARTLLNSKLAAGDTLYTSRLNEAEFRVGGVGDARAVREMAKIDRVLASMVILDFDAAAARKFAEVKAALIKKGLRTGDMDVLIASIAIVKGLSLITRNVRHFKNIPSLHVETY